MHNVSDSIISLNLNIECTTDPALIIKCNRGYDMCMAANILILELAFLYIRKSLLRIYNRTNQLQMVIIVNMMYSVHTLMRWKYHGSYDQWTL